MKSSMAGGHNTPSLEAINLTKKYGASFTALSNLNLKIEGAKCVGFLGPNGAGKTTTLKIFCDMIRASSGEAYLNGVEIRHDKKRALESCGVLIETPEIYPALTAREALSMFAEIKGIPKVERSKGVEDALVEVGMEEWINKKFGSFSRGMRQRINIAASLLGQPSILLLDEPTTGLDPRGMTEVREILKSIKEKKDRLIFMSSHLLNEIAEVCDEVAMIDRGKLLLYDTIENAVRLSSSSGIFEASFSRPIDYNLVASRLKSVDQVSLVERSSERDVRVRFSGGLETQEAVVSLLASMQIGLVSFKRSSGSALEELYLKLVSKGEGA